MMDRGEPCRIRNIIPRAAFLLLLIIPTLASDYILVSDPAQLTILNRFKAPLGSDHLKALGTPAAFKVEQLNEMSGDELSLWHRVSLGSRTLYIVVDDSGRAESSGGPVELTILRKCTDAGDTIRTIRSLTLTAGPGKGRQRKTGTDELYIRRFKYRSSWFLTSVKEGRLNGFSSLSPASAWKKEVPEKDESVYELSPVLRTRLREHLDTANRTYRDYFDWFNRQTGDTRSAPVWKYDIGSGGGTCRMTGNKETVAGMDRSTDLLVKGLRGELLGKPFSVTRAGDVITIRPERETP